MDETTRRRGRPRGRDAPSLSETTQVGIDALACGTGDVQVGFRSRLDLVAASNLSAAVESPMRGMAISNLVGFAVPRLAVARLGPEIRA
ncbi:hypothetical protein M446_5260 [Methylobacterium sp. 4-46]|uniref:hypothetical protein n=1 Tax=unclassified Methylobacterium TaxID=2615210 RepID=UPI000165CB65|nr:MULTISPECIES: hypothetical protein [Methylobacterium]ACA19584.1 hypothetical protein M446_5260 [Methylobacterium sp. 4-46]WFT78779.1 hypothetical protein QA634_26465 [Methylobacterium nodulans]